VKRILFAVAATALLHSSACLVTAQRTSFVALSEEIDSTDEGPSTDLSSASDYYEIAGGVGWGRLELFTGWGLGTQRAHVRTRTTATEPDDVGIAERAHLGASVRLGDLGPVRLRAFGILAGTLVDVLFDNSEFEEDEAIDSRTSRSFEVGLEATLLVPGAGDSDSGLFLRMGYADQAGKVSGPEFGAPDYDATAVVFTLGARLAGFWGSDQ